MRASLDSNGRSFMHRDVIVPGKQNGWTWSTCPAVYSCWTFPHGPRGMELAGDCAWGPKVICHPEYSVLNLTINLQSCQLFLEKCNQNILALRVFLSISQNLARRNSFLSITVSLPDASPLPPQVYNNLYHVSLNPFTNILFIGYFRQFVVW